MKKTTDDPIESIAISKFEATCLAVIDRVKRTGQPVIITRGGEPMACLFPPPPEPRPAGWLGVMKDRGRIVGDVVAPAGRSEDWEVRAPGEWTYSEYARLPDDGNRYEVLDGEVLVTPAPTPHHQTVILRLAMELLEYIEGRGVGWVFQDVDLLFASGHFLRPDMVVVPGDARQGITDRGIEVPPVLVVEVLSPSSRTIDRVKKPRRYLEFGVPAYWVVDPFDGEVWMWDQSTGPDAPVREAGTVRWAYPADAPTLELDVGALVGPI